ncbi:hypothetical protein HNP46_006488 [Pseudomonas nitritireducens]|uniref:DUF6036 domain-containing protein n=1 Tax=Pseudomonas nitroreducens TaxID=46680 RepID=A0A7W7P546_PSENT|nr:DUF6036 family nucleotidyltransferase [Pseudomonas nitritireducens]MBB4867574.1 hypothetical protein [Pseudomonas nitritireducens]
MDNNKKNTVSDAIKAFSSSNTLGTNDKSVIEEAMKAVDRLYTQTPLAKAAISMLSRANIYLADASPGSLKVYIFGGCAIHLLTNARGSADIDAEFIASANVKKRDIFALYGREESFEDKGREMSLSIDGQFNTSLGVLHEDYLERAIPIAGTDSNAALQIFVAAPVDVAISKLGRYGDRDMEDIQTLFKMKRMTVEDFRRLATEAIDYAVGDRSTLLSKMNHAIDTFEHGEQEYESPQP